MVMRIPYMGRDISLIKETNALQTTIRWQINDNMYLKIGGLQQTS